jgi:hypothetical protein
MYRTGGSLGGEGFLPHRILEMGSTRGSVGPYSQPLSGHQLRPLRPLISGFTPLHLLLILHRMPRTQAHDFATILLGSGGGGGHYATTRKVAGSIPNEVIEFFSRPGVNTASNRNSTMDLPGVKGCRPVRKAGNLTAICEPIV